MALKNIATGGEEKAQTANCCDYCFEIKENESDRCQNEQEAGSKCSHKFTARAAQSLQAGIPYTLIWKGTPLEGS